MKLLENTQLFKKSLVLPNHSDFRLLKSFLFHVQLYLAYSFNFITPYNTRYWRQKWDHLSPTNFGNFKGKLHHIHVNKLKKLNRSSLPCVVDYQRNVFQFCHGFSNVRIVLGFWQKLICFKGTSAVWFNRLLNEACLFKNNPTWSCSRWNLQWGVLVALRTIWPCKMRWIFYFFR